MFVHSVITTRLAAASAVVVGLMAGAPLAKTQATTASQAPASDVQAVGPRVGERVPDFTLRDQSGQPRTLTSVMGPKGLMLVFFRSADW